MLRKEIGKEIGKGKGSPAKFDQMSNSHIFSWYFSEKDNILCTGPKGFHDPANGWAELEPVDLTRVCIVTKTDTVEAMQCDADEIFDRNGLPFDAQIKLSIPYSP